jgi:hypothetical protein
MTTSLTTPTAVRPSARVRAGRIVLTAVLVLCGLVAVSTAFSDDPFPAPAVVLIATFGALAVLFGIAVVWWSGRARVVLWALPVFFVVHVAALGTWIPDAALAVVSTVGVLLAQPGRSRSDG